MTLGAPQPKPVTGHWGPTSDRAGESSREVPRPHGDALERLSCRLLHGELRPADSLQESSRPQQVKERGQAQGASPLLGATPPYRFPWARASSFWQLD